MTEHTPTPWTLCKPVETDRGRMWGINGYCETGIRGDARLAEVFSIEANAAYLVTAVNCHEELVEALRTLVWQANHLPSVCAPLAH